jgi:hypothetical protein
VDVATELLIQVGIGVATLGSTYGALRVRLVGMEKAIADLQSELKVLRGFAESSKDMLKDKINEHVGVHAAHNLRLSLLEQSKQDDSERLANFQREFKQDTRDQNAILHKLTATVAVVARASGQMRALPQDSRTEPDSEPPRPDPPSRAGYRPGPPRRSQTNE